MYNGGETHCTCSLSDRDEFTTFKFLFQFNTARSELWPGLVLTLLSTIVPKSVCIKICRYLQKLQMFHGALLLWVRVLLTVVLDACTYILVKSFLVLGTVCGLKIELLPRFIGPSRLEQTDHRSPQRDPAFRSVSSKDVLAMTGIEMRRLDHWRANSNSESCRPSPKAPSRKAQPKSQKVPAPNPWLRSSFQLAEDGRCRHESTSCMVCSLQTWYLLTWVPRL